MQINITLQCGKCNILLLTSYISVFVGLVIMNFLALFYLLMFNENNILITCWSFTLVMQLSHLPRLVSWSSSWTNRDYRIQSYQIASHLDINRDNRANRGKNFGCQKFCHDYHDWRDYRDHRIRSYDIVTNRNKSYLILFLNRCDRDRPKHRDLLR